MAADWERALGTNVKGYAWGIKHASLAMMAQGSGEYSSLPKLTPVICSCSLMGGVASCCCAGSMATFCNL